MSRSLAFFASPFAALTLAVIGATMAVLLPQPEGLILGGPCFITGLVLILRHQQVVEPRNLEALGELEAELQGLRQQLQLEDLLRGGILAHLGEGVVLIGPDRRIRLFNPAAQQLLAGSSRLAQGGTLPEVFREPESLRQVDAGFAGADTEWTLAREPRVLRLRALPFSFVGEKDGLLITVDDITRQEALETTRQKFISNASHELRTPVTAIRIAAENLQEGSPLSPEGDANLKSILRAVDRMRLLLDDISELSRIETGALHLESEDLEVHAFTQQMVEDLAPQAQAKGILLRVQVADAIPGVIVHTDPLRLGQLLGNLVGNAIKFSPERSSVDLKVSMKDKQVTWDVVDHGPGIPEAEQKRIFERFYRARATRGIPGTGLGLAIVKHLAHLMGGEVSVESEVGMGSTFTLRMPQG